ncbi:hypothetical protein [Pseudoalteromonas rubra]|nr:hypothetical protein [Pseudoalteromonas rubra]
MNGKSSVQQSKEEVGPEAPNLDTLSNAFSETEKNECSVDW